VVFLIHPSDTTDQGVAMFRDRHRSTQFATGAGLALLLAAAGCSSAGSTTASSGAARVGTRAMVGSVPAPGAVGAPAGAAVGNGAPPAPGAKTGSAASTGSTGATAIDPAALDNPDALARQASIALQVASIGQAVARVQAATAAADGIVLAESIGAPDGGPVPLADSSKVSATTYGEMTISVPSDKLDAVLGELGSVGKVIRSTSSSENVGSQIIDAQSRLATMRVSVERVRGFLDKATDLTQIVTLEAELTRRESDLEALEAQLASLKGSVARSPIQVSLTTVPAVVAPPAPATGFLAGLTNGWKAFVASVSVVLTVVGALLPFAVLALVVGVPLWLVVRRRRAVPTPVELVVP
jgi:hypothetical protein